MKGSGLFDIFKSAEIAKNITKASSQSVSAINIVIPSNK